MNAESVVVARHGGPDVLALQSQPVPQPAAGQVLIEVEAAGVAYADVLMRRGIYPETPPLPFTPGYDVVGRVVSAGRGADGLQPGARVAALTVTGGYSTHALTPAALTVSVPEDVPAAELTALVLNYVTAYQLLHRVAKVPTGASVVVLGAAGGVGTALLELAQLAGVSAIGTASGDRVSAVAGRGAIAIDRTSTDVEARVEELAPGGVAAVFDPVGGPHLRASWRMAARDGTIASYGISFAVDQGRGRLSALVRHGTAIGLNAVTPGARTKVYVIAGRRGSATRRPEQFRADLSLLAGLLQDGRLSPEVTTMPLADAARAHETLEAGQVTGKLVLVPGELR
jgi:NADPH:quinone reductase-like Zn-dependent oxidoreductase